ncbi:MAG: hypothetical protein COA79_18985 [Planctomycetota bacterium]|nr:MAG: hypothetical protein COA79_18985 [Planctomycetota bacterium]
MSRAVDQLPQYLSKYITQQNYENYTFINHAVWRYILRQNLQFFGKEKKSLACYGKGLIETGIPIDSIPKISAIDQKLDHLGWGAVPVCGFIPPVAFLEFQANCVLPIARDIRSYKHVNYTPAPDIIHEAAGHAPILIETNYADFLKMYGSIATKTIDSKENIELYESIRVLSDLKEAKRSTKEEILVAEKSFNQCLKQIDDVSESAEIVRLYWWTAEYGLLGDLKSPKIYGAGLLSSVGESYNSLTDKVKKLPLTIDCINYGYDITKQQPQLFVADSFQNMVDVLKEFEKTMAYRVGGLESLKKAQKAGIVTTTTFKNKLSISGILYDMKIHFDNIQTIQWTIAVQAGVDSTPIKEWDTADHQNGLMGLLSVPLDYKDSGMVDKDYLQKGGFKIGENISVQLDNDVIVKGCLFDIYEFEGYLQSFYLKEAKIIWSNKKENDYEELFWIFDTKVTSVYGGPLDQQSFGEHLIGEASTSPNDLSGLNEEEIIMNEALQKIRELRESSETQIPLNFIEELECLAKIYLSSNLKHWLFALELYEICIINFHLNPMLFSWLNELAIIVNDGDLFNEEDSKLLDDGLKIINNKLKGRKNA